jgi:hypothetical protein
MAKETNKQDEIFDYRTLRFLVGIVAFALPIVVWAAARIADVKIDSISASYWVDDARDLFVGALFIIATLMTAYNGHDPRGDDNKTNGSANPHPLTKWVSEKWASKVAALMAVGVALFPTTRPGGEADTDTILHYVSAILLFATITYFCLVSFRKSALRKAADADKKAKSLEGERKKKEQEIACKARRRAKIYLVCGWTIILSLALAATSSVESIGRYTGWWNLFLGELFALWAFGVSWFTASKVAPPLVQKDERHHVV